jgi:hypothetical protein
MPSIDLSLAVHVVRNNGLPVVLDSGVQVGQLFDDGRRIFEHVQTHFQKYGKIPDVVTVENDLKIIVPPMSDIAEPIAFYIDKIKERSLDILAAGKVKKMLTAADQVNTKGIIAEAQDLLHEVSKQNLAGEPIDDWTTKTDKRWSDYEAAKLIPTGLLGISTPWQGIDDLTQGIQDGDFWVLVARPGTGKTWHLIKMALHAWLYEKKVLFISLEMTLPKIKRRMDAAYAKLDYSKLKRGTLGLFVDDNYKKALESLPGKTPLHVVTRKRVKTTIDVSLLIEELKPDVVFIDGIYKLKSAAPGSKFKAHWERTMEVVDEIQELAQEKETGILVTTQFSREQKKSGKGGGNANVGLEHIGFADAIGMNADVVIALLSDDALKAKKEIILKMLKDREDDVKAWISKFDLEAMDFTQQGEYKEEDVEPSGSGDASVPYAP